jgi:hypothetical protein
MHDDGGGFGGDVSLYAGCYLGMAEFLFPEFRMSCSPRYALLWFGFRLCISLLPWRTQRLGNRVWHSEESSALHYCFCLLGMRLFAWQSDRVG